MNKTTILRWVVKVATYLGLPSDKLLHFSCAMMCMLSVSLISNECIGLIATLSVSLGKELYDRYSGKGHAEWGDLIADLLGLVAGWMVVCIINIIYVLVFCKH